MRLILDKTQRRENSWMKVDLETNSGSVGINRWLIELHIYPYTCKVVNLVGVAIF